MDVWLHLCIEKSRIYSAWTEPIPLYEWASTEIHLPCDIDAFDRAGSLVMSENPYLYPTWSFNFTVTVGEVCSGPTQYAIYLNFRYVIRTSTQYTAQKRQYHVRSSTYSCKFCVSKKSHTHRTMCHHGQVGVVITLHRKLRLKPGDYLDIHEGSSLRRRLLGGNVPSSSNPTSYGQLRSLSYSHTATFHMQFHRSSGPEPSDTTWTMYALQLDYIVLRGQPKNQQTMKRTYCIFFTCTCICVQYIHRDMLFV